MASMYCLQALLYIHGYNTPYRDAVGYAGQLAFDVADEATYHLQHNGQATERPVYLTALSFDWASMNSIARCCSPPPIQAGPANQWLEQGS